MFQPSPDCFTCFEIRCKQLLHAQEEKTQHGIRQCKAYVRNLLTTKGEFSEKTSVTQKVEVPTSKHRFGTGSAQVRHGFGTVSESCPVARLRKVLLGLNCVAGAALWKAEV